ncbi:hypothetical protein [Ferrimonas marina]|uniref:Uncharacterized protein n=1 Tax=Ferrimonas marina TaxID=299255 RepID=A0A1M5THP8_9GAMM|nr:hypothetical protein [Ferrimonas marina]SHH50219.1 hypothetical protein SAMN02745129_2148 [Ferrimonas marina]
MTAVQLNNQARAVLEAVVQSPSISPDQVCEATKLSSAIVKTNFLALRTKKLIKVVGGDATATELGVQQISEKATPAKKPAAKKATAKKAAKPAAPKAPTKKATAKAPAKAAVVVEAKEALALPAKLPTPAVANKVLIALAAIGETKDKFFTSMVSKAADVAVDKAGAVLHAIAEAGILVEEEVQQMGFNEAKFRFAEGGLAVIQARAEVLKKAAAESAAKPEPKPAAAKQTAKAAKPAPAPEAKQTEKPKATAAPAKVAKEAVAAAPAKRATPAKPAAQPAPTLAANMPSQSELDRALAEIASLTERLAASEAQRDQNAQQVNDLTKQNAQLNGELQASRALLSSIKGFVNAIPE